MIVTNYIANSLKTIVIQGINTNDNAVLFSAVTNYIKHHLEFGLNDILQICSVVIGLGGLLTGLIFTIMGNNESKKQFLIQNEETKKQFMRDCYMNFKKTLNEFLLGLNSIATNIRKINKYASILLGVKYSYSDDAPSSLEILSSINDFNMIILKIGTLVAYLQHTNYNSNSYLINKIYYDEIIETSKKILNPNIFIDIGKIMNKDIVNYVGLVNQDIQDL